MKIIQFVRQYLVVKHYTVKEVRAFLVNKITHSLPESLP